MQLLLRCSPLKQRPQLISQYFRTRTLVYLLGRTHSQSYSFAKHKGVGLPQCLEPALYHQLPNQGTP